MATTYENTPIYSPEYDNTFGSTIFSMSCFKTILNFTFTAEDFLNASDRISPQFSPDAFFSAFLCKEIHPSLQDITIAQVNTPRFFDPAWYADSLKNIYETIKIIPSSIANFFISLFEQCISKMVNTVVKITFENFISLISSFLTNPYVKFCIHLVMSIKSLFFELSPSSQPVSYFIVLSDLLTRFVSLFSNKSVTLTSDLFNTCKSLATAFVNFMKPPDGAQVDWPRDWMSTTSTALVGSLASLVYSLFAYINVFAHDDKNISNVMFKLLLFNRQNPFFRMYDNGIIPLTNCLIWIVNKVGQLFGYEELVPMFQDFQQRIATYVLKVHHTCSLTDYSQYSNPAKLQEIIDLINIGEQLLQESFSHSYNSAALVTAHAMIQKRFSSINTFLTQNVRRCEPVCALLYGKPGIGKSAAVGSIGTFLGQMMNHNGQSVWSKPQNSQFFDGYKGQPIFLYDDLFAANDPETTKTVATELLLLVSSNPTCLNMSDTVDKGSYYFTSPFILGTTNLMVDDPDSRTLLKHSLLDISALTRRFQIQFKTVLDSKQNPAFLCTSFFSPPGPSEIHAKFHDLKDKILHKVFDIQGVQVILWLRRALHIKLHKYLEQELDSAIIFASIVKQADSDPDKAKEMWQNLKTPTINDSDIPRFPMYGRGRRRQQQPPNVEAQCDNPPTLKEPSNVPVDPVASSSNLANTNTPSMEAIYEAGDISSQEYNFLESTLRPEDYAVPEFEIKMTHWEYRVISLLQLTTSQVKVIEQRQLGSFENNCNFLRGAYPSLRPDDQNELLAELVEYVADHDAPVQRVICEDHIHSASDTRFPGSFYILRHKKYFHCTKNCLHNKLQDQDDDFNGWVFNTKERPPIGWYSWLRSKVNSNKLPIASSIIVLCSVLCAAFFYFKPSSPEAQAASVKWYHGNIKGKAGKKKKQKNKRKKPGLSEDEAPHVVFSDYVDTTDYLETRTEGPRTRVEVPRHYFRHKNNPFKASTQKGFDQSKDFSVAQSGSPDLDALLSIFKNVDILVLKTPNETFKTRGIFISSGYFLTVSHFFAPLVKDGEIVLSSCSISFVEHPFSCDKFAVSICPSSDLAMLAFDHPEHMSVKNIVDKFLTFEEESLICVDTRYETLSPSADRIILGQNMSPDDILEYPEKSTGLFYECEDYLMFMGKAFPAWCGLPYFVMLQQPKICGLHIAGNRHSVFASKVNRDTLEYLISPFTIEAQTGDLPIPHINLKTSLRQLPISNHINNKYVETDSGAVLVSLIKKPSMEQYEPGCGFANLDDQRIPFSNDVYRDALSYLQMVYKSSYTHYELSLNDLVYGSPQVEIGSLDRTTSVGYPANLSYQNKVPFISDDSFSIGLKRAYEEALNDMFQDDCLIPSIEDFLSGDNPVFPELSYESYVVQFFKDEPLKPSKKPRKVYNFCMFFNLVVKHLFSPLYTMFFKTCCSKVVSVGINPYRDFLHLFKRFSKPNSFCLDFDQTRQDTTIPTRDMYFVCYFMYSLDRNSDYLRARLSCVNKLATMPIFVEGTLVTREGMNLSGNFATSAFSSMTSICLVVHCIKNLYRQSGRDFSHSALFNNFDLAVYGDDILLRCPQSDFNLPWSSLPEIASTCGRILTPGDKESTVIVPKPLSSCTYLKRSFRKHVSGVCCPLNFQSLFEMFNYVPKDTMVLENLNSLVRSASIESSQHGYKFYNSFGTLLNEAFIKCYNKPIIWPSWSSVISSIQKLDYCEYESDDFFDILAQSSSSRFKDVWKRIHHWDFIMEHMPVAQSGKFDEDWSSDAFGVVDSVPDTSVSTSLATDNQDGSLAQVTTISSTMFNITSVEGQEIYTPWPRVFDYKSFIQYDSPQIDKLMRRRFLMQHGTWTTSQGFQDTLYAGGLGNLLDHPSIACRLTNYKYFRFDVSFTVVLNATRFHAGQLLLNVCPLRGNDSIFGSFRSAYMIPAIFVSANTTTTATVVCPWCHPYPWIDRQYVDHYLEVSLEVFQPLLAINQNASSTVSWQIYAELQNLQVSGPFYDEQETYAQSGRMEAVKMPDVSAPDLNVATGNSEPTASTVKTITTNLAADVKDAVNTEAVEKSARGLLGGVASTVSSGVKNVGDFLTSTVSNSVDSLVSKFSFSGLLHDKPHSIAAPVGFYNVQDYDMQLSDGMSLARKYALKISSAIPQSLSAVCSLTNDMSISSICMRPGLVTRFSVDSSNIYLSSVNTVPVSPHAGNGPGQMMSPLSWCSSHFEFWRGTLRFTYYFCASQFAAAKFRIAFQPYISGLLPTNEETLTDAYSQLVEVKGDTVYHVDIPFVYDKPWCHMYDPLHPDVSAIGQVSVFVVNPIAQMDTSADASIRCAVFVCANPDFQVASPKNSTCLNPESQTPLLPLVTILSTPPATAQTAVRSFATRPINNISHARRTIDEGFIMGEKVESIRQLASRFYYLKTVTVTSGEPINVSITESDSNVTFSSRLHELLYPFLFLRGSYRVKFRRKSGSSVLMSTSYRPSYASLIDSGEGICLFQTNTTDNTVEFLPYTNSINYTWSEHKTTRGYFDDFNPSCWLYSDAETVLDIFLSIGDDFHAGFFCITPFLQADASPLPASSSQLQVDELESSDFESLGSDFSA